MTTENFLKAERLHNHIEELTKFKNELSIVIPIRIGDEVFKLSLEDVDALTKTLEERISKLEKEFEEL